MHLRRIALCSGFAAFLLPSLARASFINYTAKEINVKIVYVAPAGTTLAAQNMNYIYGKTAPEAKSKMVDVSTITGKNVVFFDFLPLELGEIRGFKTRFNLYALHSTDDATAEDRRLVLKGVDGVVFIVDCRPSMAQANVDALANLQADLKAQGYDYEKIPLTFQFEGGASEGSIPSATLKQILRAGDRPSFDSDVAQGIGVFDTLKSVAKQVLIALKSGADTNVAAKKKAAR